MKKYTAFIVFSFVVFFSATTIFAQPGSPEQIRPFGQAEAQPLPGQPGVREQQRLPGPQKFVMPQRLPGPQNLTEEQRLQWQQRFEERLNLFGESLTEEQRLQWHQRFTERLNSFDRQRSAEQQRVPRQPRVTEQQRMPKQPRAIAPQRVPGQQRSTERERAIGEQRVAGEPRFGFTGPTQAVTAAEASEFANRTPLIVQGTIVHSTGPDRYLFRDSSGDIIVRIGQSEWRRVGSTVGPYDNVEISGVLYKDEQRAPEIRVSSIRKLD